LVADDRLADIVDDAFGDGVLGQLALLIQLAGDGISTEPTPLSPWGLRVVGRERLVEGEAFAQGLIEIQDEGAQLASLLVGAQPGMAVLDFCAGAGGKTLAIAALMQNKGRVVACDVLETRLKKGRERFTRAGLDTITLRPIVDETDDWIKRNAGKYDRVLVDAPCTGSGTWRRNPDARWKQLGPDLATLMAMQSRILASAARLVKKGGRLIYATCSMLMQENQQQVTAFLTANSAFTLVPITDLPAKDGFMILTPAQHKTDGFFGAVMVKSST
jgi:16S rRNA (cytosine967-C5)-methyltransferase